jgi:hypothetical protein
MCYARGTAQELCVIVSSEERAKLTAVIADRNRPRKNDRARIILRSADRLAAAEVARRRGRVASALHGGDVSSRLQEQTENP